MSQSNSHNNTLAYIIVLLLGGTAGGGVSLLQPDTDTKSIETRISVLEARIDILWEAEKSRVARQIGDMR